MIVDHYYWDRCTGKITRHILTPPPKPDFAKSKVEEFERDWDNNSSESFYNSFGEISDQELKISVANKTDIIQTDPVTDDDISDIQESEFDCSNNSTEFFKDSSVKMTMNYPTKSNIIYNY
ncbi:hypothetical protein FQA39_LY02814 [Lamprigera yunnana]|nr:hypothetical protein FQA39_LY02814 [Lamprigera yunnana]